jgi:hypothetical protein
MEHRATNDLVIGLKKQVKRQVCMRNNAEEYINDLERQIIYSWNMLYKFGNIDTEQLKNIIWTFVSGTNEIYWVSVMSADIGLFSKILDYENKNGKKHAAHFNESNKYLGTVKSLGNKAISYKTYANVVAYKSLFNIDLNKLQDTKNIASIFALNK